MEEFQKGHVKHLEQGRYCAVGTTASAVTSCPNDLDLNTKNLVDAIIRQKDVFEKTHTILQRQQHLEKLVVATAASFNSDGRCNDDSDCIQNTRVSLLRDMGERADRNVERPVFRLRGAAGTGKSTIARTTAHCYHDRRRAPYSKFPLS